MTTIAYNRGEICCDSQSTVGGLACKAKMKAIKTATHVYMIAGNFAQGMAYIDWLKIGGPISDVESPKLSKTSVIQMDLKTGKCVEWEDDVPLPVEDRIMAWGSGGNIALGAMAAGADVYGAVNIACKWDAYSGGRAQYFISEAAKKRLSKIG